MAISITRRCAQQLRSVFHRAFGSRDPGPSVCFTAAAGMLSVKASSADVAVEYHAPHDQTAEPLWLPFQFLDDCAGKKDEPVHVEPTGTGRATAQWRDGSVPQIVQYDTAEPATPDKFPPVPETFAENPPRLLQALADAGETCDPDAVRFALGCLQFRGQQGSIGATDGRQMLVQSGFAFPWEGDLLIPRSKVFCSPESGGDQPVLVGQSGDSVAFRRGAWTFWLAVNKDGRFPDLSRQIPHSNGASARCSMSAADTEFLTKTLPKLPCDDDYNGPVTLDLNGHVAIRAKAAEQPCPTEVLLSGSSWSGEPIRLNTNRKYLARAAKLGFRDLCIYSNQAPVLCQDEYRQYLWAVLAPESAIPPAEDALRIESPIPMTSVSPPKTRRKTLPMSETAPNPANQTQSNGRAAASGQTKLNGRIEKPTPRKSGQQDLVGLIEQAEGLRTSLRETLGKTNELLKGLKHHRRQNRVVQNTLTSLRQLRTLGV